MDLTDFSKPFDIAKLDRIVSIAASANATPTERKDAERAMVRFKEHPESWTRADVILERAQNPQSKFFALQILEDLAKSRWKIVPQQPKNNIKNYIVNLAIKLSSDEATLRANKVLLRKLNYVLVIVIKQEWPNLWTSFIPEIVGASKTNESLCENNMEILSILSEEVFEFGKDTMTRAKAKELRQSFNREFSDVFKLCEFVLERSQKISLVKVTLQTLLRFLNWIPLTFIFETGLLQTLVTKFLPVDAFKASTLRCCAEIAAMKAPSNYDGIFVKFFVAFMDQLKRGNVSAPEMIPKMYDNGNMDVQHFVNHLAQFFVGYLKEHLVLIERAPELQNYLMEAHNYLVNLTLVDEREIFKICLEYWFFLSSSLYHDSTFSGNEQTLLLNNSYDGPRRRDRYAPILSRIRLAVIQRMAKPEEVLIVEDENGDIIRERTKDTDQIEIYKDMKETLVYLTHLDPVDTQKIMLDLLQKVCDGRSWSWHNVNTLSWAIGSISGAQSEETEKRFLIMVVKDLLTLTEIKHGKANKAVIASDIMYVVGQYPRFLRAHWRFLRTVVLKLFEFMLETHPGVQDMAVDTFLKIAKSCRRKFVVIQNGETQPFIEMILEEIDKTVRLLEPQQICVFYKALGVIIASCVDHNQQYSYLSGALRGSNQAWVSIMQKASKNTDELKNNANVVKTLSNILKTNIAICAPLGKVYAGQLSGLHRDMLNVYKIYSEIISNTLEQNGAKATGNLQIRLMRRVKRQVLILVSTYVETAQDAQHVPHLLQTVLVDYPRSIPEARDHEVLRLISTVCAKLGNNITQAVPQMFSSVFQCTLNMLINNFTDYPDHRQAFFAMLESIVQYQFAALLNIAQQSGAQFKLVIDSIIYGLKHTERTVSERSVQSLLTLLRNVEKSPVEFANAFYKSHLLYLVQNVLFVLTDSMHKSNFKNHAQILALMYGSVVSGKVRVPLSPDQNVNNLHYIRNFTGQLLSKLPTLNNQEIGAFVNAVTNVELLSNPQQFQAVLRDFLVALKEFSLQDNAELYEDLEERKRNKEKQMMSIPGMIAPQDHPEYDPDLN